MKRKLIQTLLTCDQLSDQVLKLLPGDMPSLEAVHAREVLTLTIKRFKDSGTATPEAVYGLLAGGTAAQIADFLKGDLPSKVSKAEIARAQGLLSHLLTSKAGRPKTNDLSRQEQNAIAQSSRRVRLKKYGRKQINVWIDPDAASYLDTIQKIYNCSSKADALEFVLDRDSKNNPILISKK